MALAAPRRRPARRLAPLDADQFLRWAWMNGPRDKGTSPLTVEDLWFELAPGVPGLTVEDVRREYVRLAARVRRNQRFGWEPFETFERWPGRER